MKKEKIEDSLNYKKKYKVETFKSKSFNKLRMWIK